MAIHLLQATSSSTSPSTAPTAATAVRVPLFLTHSRVPQLNHTHIVITQLVKSSDALGLSAFLPSPARRSPSTSAPADPDAIPHLPLVADWHDGKFALKDVMRSAPDVSVREWSMRLMQRYRYVIGTSPSARPPTTPDSAR